MLSLKVKNVNEALPLGILMLNQKGVVTDSRYGTTIEIPEPVCTTYLYPNERVLFNKDRDANPFFTLFEALWIIGGRRDVAFLTQFNKRMSEFSDDGEMYHAAYGYRLRHNGQDQIAKVIDLLRDDPNTRRAVLQIWDHTLDLSTESVDIPCNDMIFLKIRDNRLNITVANRSNDAIWGAYGTNVVQFSMLQEYIADKVGCELGVYNQVSDSFHVYHGEQWDKLKGMSVVPDDPYSHDSLDRHVTATELGAWSDDWDSDLQAWLEAPFAPVIYDTYYFEHVIKPLSLVWKMHKSVGPTTALRVLDEMHNCDWELAAREWLTRRIK